MASIEEGGNVEVKIEEEPPQDFTMHMNTGRNIIEEMKSELSALDPSFVHSIRLLEEEIKKMTTSVDDPTQPQKEKIYISQEDQKAYNLVGRLLGPKGLTLKRIQAETCTKMSILGKGSIKDRSKEEELRTSGNSMYTHLNEDLHVLIEAGPPSSVHKIAAGAAEVRKMLIPPEPGQPDFAAKYDVPPGRPPYSGSPFRGPPPPHYGGGGGGGGRGGYHQMQRGGRGRMGSRGRGGGGRRDDRRSGDGSQWNREGGAGGGGDAWRDGTISKDYNHGVSSGYGSDTAAAGGSTTGHPFSSDSYSTGMGTAGSTASDVTGYYSAFTDTSTEQGDAYGSARNGGRNEWKSAHGARRDYRYHPYENGPDPSTGTGSATGYYW